MSGSGGSQNPIHPEGGDVRRGERPAGSVDGGARFTFSPRGRFSALHQACEVPQLGQPQVGRHPVGELRGRPMEHVVALPREFPPPPPPAPPPPPSSPPRPPPLRAPVP